jgi:hypothetical protein
VGKGPFSNSGFKTGPRQIAWSGFENARFAKFGLLTGFEIGDAVRHLPGFETAPVTSQSRRVTPRFFHSRVVSSDISLLLLLLHPPMSANQENITPATSLKLKIPGKYAQARTKRQKPKAPPNLLSR